MGRKAKNISQDEISEEKNKTSLNDLNFESGNISTDSEINADLNTEIFKDSSQFFHFLTLSIAVLTFAIGFGSTIVSFEKVYFRLFQLPNMLALPTILGLMGVGFILGMFYWKKLKQNVFKVSAFSLIILLIVNLILYLFPNLLKTLTITAINDFGVNENSFFAFPFASSIFILLITVAGGFFLSLMIPAISLVDIWHRERLRRKKLYIAPPVVRRNLSIWAPFVIFLAFLGYFIASIILSNSKIIEVEESKTGFLVSLIFISISLIACVMYTFFKPSKVDIYDHDNYDVTTVGFKLFGWRSRLLVSFASMLGIIGLTTLFIVFITQYNLILRFALIDASDLSFPASIFIMVGLIAGIILLRIKISVNTVIYFGLLFLILSYILSVFAFGSIQNPNNNVFESMSTLSLMLIGLIGLMLAVFFRYARVFIEAEVYKEGKILSRSLGLGLLIGSLISVFLITGVDSPFKIIQFAFIIFSACSILAVVIAPTGIWKARNDIMNLGETYFEKDRKSLKSLVISLLYAIGLTALVIGWNYYEDTVTLEGYKFYNGHSVAKISEDINTVDYEIDGENITFSKKDENYSFITACIGNLNNDADKSNSAYLTNNLEVIEFCNNLNPQNSILVNPFGIMKLGESYQNVTNPYLWVSKLDNKYHYLHIDINSETAKFILETGLIKAISEKLNEKQFDLVSFNIDLRDITPNTFKTAINEITGNFEKTSAYYLPNMLIILNKKPDNIDNKASKNIEFKNLYFPSQPSNMLKELDFWEIKTNHIDKIDTSSDLSSFEIINTTIIDNFCEIDSLPHLTLKALNLLKVKKLEEAKKFALDARNRYRELSFHESSLQNETNFPTKYVYNEIQYEIYYQNALESMQQAKDAESPLIRKNRLNDAMIWGDKASELKPNEISALIICYKAAKLLDARDLDLFEKKIKDLDPKALENLTTDDFANK